MYIYSIKIFEGVSIIQINLKSKEIIIKTSETVFVKNECLITPFLLTHTLNDLFDLQGDLGRKMKHKKLPVRIV